MTILAPDLVSLLRRRTAASPDAVAVDFLDSFGRRNESLDYAALDREARAIAGLLRRRAHPGDRVVIAEPPGVRFVAAFFGVLYAQMIAVPVALPHGRKSAEAERLARLVRDCDAQVLLAPADVAAQLRAFPEMIAFVGAGWIDVAARAGHDFQPEPPDPEAIAFIQYTSGSTGDPKGVVIRHRNVIHNAERIVTRCRLDASSRALIWLPHFHDLGLVGGIVTPIYAGFSTSLMAPSTFIKRPLGWLRIISDGRYTISGGPNFAYALCVKALDPAKLAGIDLAAWTCAFNCAEPIDTSVVQGFVRAFAPWGFREDAFYPCYGMAESTLSISSHIGRRPPVIRTVDAIVLEAEARATLPRPNRRTRSLVSVGQASPGQRLVIVDPERRAVLGDNQVGEIWTADDSVAAGYWGRPEATELAFRATLPDYPGIDFLRTGDLGYIENGELFIAGRIKDCIIIDGRNVDPADIEAGIHAAVGAPTRAVAAFSVDRSDGRGETLVVAIEAERRQAAADLQSTVRRAVSARHDLTVGEIVVVPPGAIPRTTSGKVRRSAVRMLFLSGGLARMVDSPGKDDTLAPGNYRSMIAVNESSQSAERRLWLSDLVTLLEEIPLFAGLSGEERALIAEQCEFRMLAGGETLITEGENASELYVVVSGRLKAVRRNPAGERVLGEIRRGELVGEMALMTEDRRMASVYAIRDSVVASLSRAAFDELTTRFPRIVKHVVRVMVRRLTEPKTRDQRASGMTIAVVAAGEGGADTEAFAESLAQALGKIGKTTAVHARAVPKDADHRTSAWLNAIEMQHRFLIYVADERDEAWTRLCVRQADRILLIGAADMGPALGRLESSLDNNRPPVLAQRDLVLLHSPETRLPAETRRWLAARPAIARHFHARRAHPGDFGRLARILAQQPLGVTFGGGGARGFAHLGVYRALSEAGLAVDLVGGTSIGAVFGGLIAMGLDWQEVTVRCRGLENTKLDYTLPLVAISGGFKLSAAVREMFGDVQIEDLWLPYFCVTSNLTRAEIAVHREGPASKWIRSSCSLPGVLPPVFDGAEIHVDGCILDNLPTDIMRADCRGPIIAVDIDQSYDISTDMPFTEGLSGWRLLAGRMKLLGARRRVPTMARLLQRAAMVTSTQNSLRARTEADLYLHPPVGNCGVLDWKLGEQLTALAYEYAAQKIAEWPLAAGLAAGMQTTHPPAPTLSAAQ